MLFKKKLLGCMVSGALILVSGGAMAAGFSLLEQNASGMGNAYAGGAAVADDASTIFFNPAGLTRLSGKQLVVATHAIRPSIKFTNTGSTAASLQTLGGSSGDAGAWVLVPNAYFAAEISPKLKAGVGLNAPFGLQTQYSANWMGRFQAINSSIKTINLNPSLAYEVNDTLSIGAGLNYQQITGELTNSVNYSAAAGGALGAGLEGVGTLTGSDSAWGYNLGSLFKISPQTRIGVAYRSRINFNLKGTAIFANRPPALNAALPNQAVTLAITMPESFSASVFHQIDDKWDVMADATMTGWSSFQQLNVLKANGASLSPATPENWHDTWRIAVGGNYHYSEQWTSRMGLAFDQSPVPDAFRTARMPDANRFQISLGGQYKPGHDSAIDFGYSHLFVNAASIADLQGAAKGNLVGSYQNSADILSVQYTKNF